MHEMNHGTEGSFFTDISRTASSSLFYKSRHKQTGILCGLLHRKMRPYETREQAMNPQQVVNLPLRLFILDCNHPLV